MASFPQAYHTIGYRVNPPLPIGEVIYLSLVFAWDCEKSLANPAIAAGFCRNTGTLNYPSG